MHSFYVIINPIHITGFNSLGSGSKQEGTLVPVCGTAFSTNLTQSRSMRMETGRAVYIFKSSLPSSSTQDMSVTQAQVQRHTLAINSKTKVSYQITNILFVLILMFLNYFC